MKKLLVTLMCVIMVLAMMPVMAFGAVSSEAMIGNEPYDSLGLALSNAKDGDVITLQKDVNLTSLLKVEKDVTIDGNGKTVTATSQKAFEVYADAKFVDVTIKAAQRCIDTREAVSLELDNVTLEATSLTYGNSQPLTIGGYTEGKPVKVYITNSGISAGDSGYGIIMFNPVDMDLVHTSVEGFAALYFKEGSSNSVVNMEDSSVAETDNIHNGLSNSFGTVVFQDAGITVNVDNSVVSGTSSGDQTQTVFLQNDEYFDFTESYANTVNIYNGSKIVADSTEDLATVSKVAPGKNVIVFKNATCNVEIPKAFIAEGYTATKDTTTGLWTVKCAGHTYVSGVCKVCGAAEPVVKVESVPTVDATKPVEKVEVGTTEATKEVLAETSAEVIEAVTKGEEVKNVDKKVVEAIEEAVAAGDDVEVTTTVVATPVDEKDVEATFGKDNVVLVEKAAGDATVAQYLDLSVLMTVSVNGQEVATGEVEELAKEVTFTIAIPEELKAVKEGVTREYYVIRVHEGKTDKLPVTVNADGTLSFKTDRFSTYALAYEDKETPKTGDTNAMMPWLAVMVVAAAGAVVLRKKEN